LPKKTKAVSFTKFFYENSFALKILQATIVTFLVTIQQHFGLYLQRRFCPWVNPPKLDYRLDKPTNSAPFSLQ